MHLLADDNLPTYTSDTPDCVPLTIQVSRSEALYIDFQSISCLPVFLGSRVDCRPPQFDAALSLSLCMFGIAPKDWSKELKTLAP